MKPRAHQIAQVFLSFGGFALGGVAGVVASLKLIPILGPRIIFVPPAAAIAGALLPSYVFGRHVPAECEECGAHEAQAQGLWSRTYICRACGHVNELPIAEHAPARHSHHWPSRRWPSPSPSPPSEPPVYIHRP